MGGVGKIIGTVLLILIVGLGIHIYQLYTAANKIEITKISVASFRVEGFPRSPLPSTHRSPQGTYTASR